MSCLSDLHRIATNFGAFLDAHSEAISAVSAVFVAAFTYTLWRTTSRQAGLTANIIALTREDFLANHRPKIILRDAILDNIKIAYTLVNVGGASATVVESVIKTELVAPKDPLKPLRSLGYNDLGSIRFEGGELKDLNLDVLGKHGFFIRYPNARRIRIEDEPALDKHRLYFVGALRYSDERGVKRRSVFRRQWSDASEGFVRVDNPDQEYAD